MKLNERACVLLSGLAGIDGVREKQFALNDHKATVFDVGVAARLTEKHSRKAGLLTAAASAGGLAFISINGRVLSVKIPKHVALATLGCQMAGWAIPVGGETALGSGPARILAQKPSAIYQKIRYHETAKQAALLLEAKSLPDEQTFNYVFEKTNVNELVVAVFKGDSPVGLLNVLARVVELAVFRLDYLGYDANKIVSARGSVRIPKEAGMCAANDALIYDSSVELQVKQWDDSLAEKCVSTSSSCFGKKFKELYEQAGCNFYKMDESIFAPARLTVRKV